MWHGAIKIMVLSITFIAREDIVVKRCHYRHASGHMCTCEYYVVRAPSTSINYAIVNDVALAPILATTICHTHRYDTLETYFAYGTTTLV